MPLRLFRHRNRAFAYLNVLILGAALMSQFFFLTQLLQNALGYSALQAGVAFLPMALTQLVAARSTPRIIARYGMKVPMLSGVLLVVAGMAWLTRITDEVGYLTGVLAPMLLFGIGVGLCFMPLNTTIMTSVEERDAGSASGLLQALLQIGGSVGIAILTTVYSTAVRQSAAGLLPGDAPSRRTTCSCTASRAPTGAGWSSPWSSSSSSCSASRPPPGPPRAVREPRGTVVRPTPERSWESRAQMLCYAERLANNTVDPG